MCHAGCEAYKRRLAYSVTVNFNFIATALKSFITKVLEYKARVKFVCIAVFLNDESLHCNTLNSSRLIVHSTWFLDGKTSTCYNCDQIWEIVHSLHIQFFSFQVQRFIISDRNINLCIGMVRYSSNAT